jgi:16S rRNA (cytidine1402-2'-O)-methyltransferase
MERRVSEVASKVSNASGTLFVVATPIGNRDDMTARAVDVLRSVDRILAEDTRHSRPLLAYHGIQRPLFSLHEHNEDVAMTRVIGMLKGGESLALISDAGTPLISDPGFPLVRACREQAIPVVTIPGPSALIAALSVAGLPTDRFRFEGFLPRKRQARLARFEVLQRENCTLAWYESSHRIRDTLDDMVAVFGPDREACLARELTKVHETVEVRPLGALREFVHADDNQARGELVLLLAGLPEAPDRTLEEIDRVLVALLEELPLKRAAAVAARITGEKKNRLYQRALDLQAGEV